ncbi:MAG: hypothetical protein COW79_01900 [Bdellovibrionales bacterium CG22_combo_CG10-13_8_21_14_all_38_13]|nr:MAG: hypothetical protein COW79_01900 [Bdellovibrionales bacterium CG22_combo_CG10-13_8_21_14_all_38_13]
MSEIKELYFLDNAYKEYMDLPDTIKQEFGFKLWQVQNGIEPANTKSMSGMKGIFELREWSNDSTYRAMYTTIIKGKIVVLHAFQKKSQKTPQKNLEIIRKRQKEALEEFK